VEVIENNIDKNERRNVWVDVDGESKEEKTESEESEVDVGNERKRIDLYWPGIFRVNKEDELKKVIVKNIKSWKKEKVGKKHKISRFHVKPINERNKEKMKKEDKECSDESLIIYPSDKASETTKLDTYSERLLIRKKKKKSCNESISKLEILKRDTHSEAPPIKKKIFKKKKKKEKI
jgi:hypothetical protein